MTYTRGRDLGGSLASAGGIGGLLARTDNGQLNVASSTAHAYYHGDGNGNVTPLIDTNQLVVGRYLFDAFGNLVAASGSLANANLCRFSSKEIHAASGLVFFLRRFYDPALQRWLSRDPVGETDDINLFSYVRNQAVGRIDPWGALAKAVTGAPAAATVAPAVTTTAPVLTSAPTPGGVPAVISGLATGGGGFSRLGPDMVFPVKKPEFHWTIVRISLGWAIISVGFNLPPVPGQFEIGDRAIPVIHDFGKAGSPIALPTFDPKVAFNVGLQHLIKQDEFQSPEMKLVVGAQIAATPWLNMNAKLAVGDLTDPDNLGGRLEVGADFRTPIRDLHFVLEGAAEGGVKEQEDYENFNVKIFFRFEY